MPNSSGLVSMKDCIAPEDAPVVQRLKASGAIALGVTTVPELCMWWETSNNIYGITNNAYDSRRIVGGSSGMTRPMLLLEDLMTGKKACLFKIESSYLSS